MAGPSFISRTSTQRRGDDDFSPAYYYLKVYVGGLPRGATEADMLSYFSRYGPVADTWLYRSSDPAKMNLPPYGFVTFRNAADADAAVASEHDYQGAHTLQVNYATMKKSASSAGTLESAIPSGALDESAVGTVAASGLTIAGATETELGEFFSQWGLVLLVLKSAEEPSSCLVQYSAREGAVRLLAEPTLSFKGAAITATQRDVPANLGFDEEYLVRRATARHRAKTRSPYEGNTEASLLDLGDPPQLPKLRGYEFSMGRLMAGRPRGESTVPIELAPVNGESGRSSAAVLRPRSGIDVTLRRKSGDDAESPSPKSWKASESNGGYDNGRSGNKRRRRGSSDLSRSRRRSDDKTTPSPSRRDVT